MLPDYIKENLKIMFVGFNPGERSDLLGHNFAGRNNQFWRLLHDAGLTPELIQAENDKSILDHGYGLTNIVARASKSSSDLSWSELKEGALELRRKVELYRPKVVCLLGKQVYQAYAGLKNGAKVEYGPQFPSLFPGITDYLAPNPSGRSTVPYALKKEFFEGLKIHVQDYK